MAIREANFKLRLAAECLKSNFSALTSLKRDERIETWFFFSGNSYGSAVLNVVGLVLTKHNNRESCMLYKQNSVTGHRQKAHDIQNC